MRKQIFVVLVLALSLVLAADAAWAQMGGQGMMRQPNQPPLAQYGMPGYGPGMMGPGYGGGYGRGMMMGGGYGGGYGMSMGGYGGMGMGGGMMNMMMGHMMGGGMMGMGLMLPYLNLSSQQWEQVQALVYQRLEKMTQLRSKLYQQNLQLLNLAAQPKVDAAKVKKLFVQQAELKAELFLVGLDYLQKVKGILTPAQKKQLNGFGLR